MNTHLEMNQYRAFAGLEWVKKYFSQPIICFTRLAQNA